MINLHNSPFQIIFITFFFLAKAVLANPDHFSHGMMARKSEIGINYISNLTDGSIVMVQVDSHRMNHCDLKGIRSNPENREPKLFCVLEGESGASGPSVAGLKNGGFVVVWKQFHSHEELELRFQIFSSRNEKIEGIQSIQSKFKISTETKIGVIPTRKGGFLVSWSVKDENEWRVYLREYNEKGIDISNPSDTYIAGAAREFSVSQLGEDYAIAWVHHGILHYEILDGGLLPVLGGKIRSQNSKQIQSNQISGLDFGLYALTWSEEYEAIDFWARKVFIQVNHPNNVTSGVIEINSPNESYFRDHPSIAFVNSSSFMVACPVKLKDYDAVQIYWVQYDLRLEVLDSGIVPFFSKDFASRQSVMIVALNSGFTIAWMFEDLQKHRGLAYQYYKNEGERDKGLKMRHEETHFRRERKKRPKNESEIGVAQQMPDYYEGAEEVEAQEMTVEQEMAFMEEFGGFMGIFIALIVGVRRCKEKFQVKKEKIKVDKGIQKEQSEECEAIGAESDTRIENFKIVIEKEVEMKYLTEEVSDGDSTAEE